MILVFALWFSLIVIASIICSSAGKHAGTCTQVLFLLSYPLAWYIYNVSFGVVVSYEALVRFVIASLILLAFLYPTRFLPDWELEYIPKGLERYVVVYLVAPVGEEGLFRFLLVGGLIYYGLSRYHAIIISAVLFSLIHIMPFSKAPRKVLAFVLIDAFVLGFLAGYLFVFYGIIYAIAIHSLANIIGSFLR